MTRYRLHYFFLFTYMAAFVPYFPLFLHDRGYSVSQVGLLMGCMSLFGVFGPIVLGRLGDRLGLLRELLLAMLVVFALAMLAFNNVTGMVAGLALAAVVGFANRPAIALTDALACQHLPQPTHQYGQARVLGSAGWIAALQMFSITGMINEDSSVSILLPILATVLLVILTGVTLPRSVRAAPQTTQAPAPARIDKAFCLWLALIFLAQIAMAAHYAFFSPYLTTVVGQKNVGWVWSIGAMAEIPMILFAGAVIRRFGLPMMMMAAMAAMSLRVASYGFWPILAVIVPAQLLHAFTFGAFHTSSVEFVRRKLGRARGGLGMALYMGSANGLSYLVGAGVGGYLVAAWGYRRMFELYAIAPLISLVGVFLARRAFDLPNPPLPGFPVRLAPSEAQPLPETERGA